MRHALRAAVLGSAVLLLSPAPAWAHAGITRISPAAGTLLASAPPLVSITFSEPVSLDAASILDSTGSPIPIATRMAGRTLTIVPQVKPSNGPIAVTWTVTSDDGHQVGGSTGYVIGRPAPTGSPRRLTTSPQIPVQLSGTRAGLLTVTFARSAASGSVTWSHSSLAGPMTWPITSAGRQSRAIGVLPLGGVWHMTATLIGKDGSILIITGDAPVESA